MKKMIFWSLFVLLMAGLACSLPFGLGGDSQPAASLPGADDDSFNADLNPEAPLTPVELSGAQRQVLSVRGRPDRFVINFSDGMREETWYYDAEGYDITFRNGDTFTENQWNPVPADQVMKSHYSPWQFNEAMGLSELLVVSGSDAFTLEQLDEVFGEAVSLVALAGLDAGFRDGRLLFVRAVPLNSVALVVASSDPLGESADLTAVEQNHVGTHAYQVFCSYSDGTTEEGEEEMTWRFTDEGVYFDENGPFPRVSPNNYRLADDAGELFIHIQDNYITMTDEFHDVGPDGEEMLVSWVCVFTLQ